MTFNLQVTTTCNSNAINLVKGLGPDNIVDYTSKDVYKQLENYGKYVNIIVISNNLSSKYQI